MTKISSEKINYGIFFVAAIAIVSVAILIEKPVSLADAIPQLNNGDQPEDSATDAEQNSQEGPQGDGDGETNDDG